VVKAHDSRPVPRLKAALAALGTEGDHNGVIVTFAALPRDVAGDTRPSDAGDGKINYQVTFDAAKIHSENDQAIHAAHEGTHIADMSDPRFNSKATGLTPFQVEYRAYQTSAWAASALGHSSLSMKYEGKSYMLWNGSWAEVDRNITNFITKFRDEQGNQTHPETHPHNPWPN